MFEETFAGRQRLLGAVHPDMLSSRNDVARVLATTGGEGPPERQLSAITLLSQKSMINFADLSRTGKPQSPN
ncbi:hypothetical protein GCM10022224_070840 [Nonomuraea antimicrobica]|uniref:Uncharacterized protein n=1 Tax=Nonomuraea antimicrobica TaxID=561173 RepID=A0ABP7CV55_9ACTN